MVKLATSVQLATLLAGVSVSPCGAQEVGDPLRLTGVTEVSTRAHVTWDEEIVLAGGATGGQYEDALIAAFDAGMSGSRVALDQDAPGFLMCRVETTFDGVIIAYSLRVEYHEPLGADGEPAITWFKSWLGTYGMQQLHLMFGLGTLCAEAFEEDWNLVN